MLQPSHHGVLWQLIFGPSQCKHAIQTLEQAWEARELLFMHNEWNDTIEGKVYIYTWRSSAPYISSTQRND